MTATWNGADQARHNLRDLKAQAHQVRLQLNADRQAIGRLQDPLLSDQGLVSKREQLRREVDDRAAQLLADIDRKWQQNTQRVREFAQQHRATVTDDPVQLQRMSVAWDTVRRLIDNGRPLHTLLTETTSTDVLLAMREWAPDYLRAGGEVGSGYDPSTLALKIDTRIAHLQGGDAADAMAMLQEAESLDAGWTVTRDHAIADATGTTTRGSNLGMAVAAVAAEQATAASYQPARNLEEAIAQRMAGATSDQFVTSDHAA